ncbi:TPA: MarR family transcriptional regulator [Acinetobacter baumannii]|nr:MarR family transcriptional regulator [Acinetobacter baumannii]
MNILFGCLSMVGKKTLGHYLDHLHGLVATELFPHMGKAVNGDFSFSQLNTLFLLYKQSPCSIAEIAENAGISHNAASRMVNRLVQGGYVTRDEDKLDRRQKKVTLTYDGLLKLRELQIITTDVYNKIFSNIPKELCLKLESVLKEIEIYLPEITKFDQGQQNRKYFP